MIEPRFCPSCGFHLRRVGPEGDVILSDRTLECLSCGRRVALHTSWARSEGGHYVVVGWLIRNLTAGELVDEPPAPAPARPERAKDEPRRRFQRRYV